MAMPTERWVETLSGLGASGVHVLLAWRPKGGPTPTGHPMLPMLSVALAPAPDDGAAAVSSGGNAAADVLLPPNADAAEWGRLILERVAELASGRYTPLVFASGNVDFQIARGHAVSL